MDIADAVSTDFVSFESSTPTSKLRGTFDNDQQVRVIVIADGGEFQGVVTQKQLVSSHHSPDQKAGSVMRSPPRVSRTEDVREVARLMVESELKLLPVFEGTEFYGVVTATGLLRLVRENLGVLSVADVYTRDLISVSPDSTLGEVINTIRTQGITRVPVIDDGEAVGLVSVYDLVAFTTREMKREQGGSSGGFDQHGGTGSDENFLTHGGYGERAGFAARMLDLPARDVMNTPAATVDLDGPLDETVAKMLDNGYASLVVTASETATPVGIVTTTDALRSLTWTDEERIDVQVFGVDLLDDIDREAIARRIEAIAEKHSRMTILEANVNLHKHKERMRGTPLLLSTVRLFTDQGIFAGSGEGYGARAAFDEASEILEQNVLSEKERDHPRQIAEKERERAAEILGWWLEA